MVIKIYKFSQEFISYKKLKLKLFQYFRKNWEFFLKIYKLYKKKFDKKLKISFLQFI